MYLLYLNLLYNEDNHGVLIFYSFNDQITNNYKLNIIVHYSNEIKIEKLYATKNN